MKTIINKLQKHSLIAALLATALAGCDGQEAKAPEESATPKVAEIETAIQPSNDVPTAATQPVPEKVVATVSQSDCPYETTLEAGIDFGRPCWPDILQNVEGVTPPYWSKPYAMRSSDATIAPGIKLTFAQDLPLNFELVIDGFAHQKNSGKPVVVKIGKTEKKFIYKDEYVFGSLDRPYEEIKLSFNLNKPSNTIEIVPPNPVTYKEAGYPSEAKEKFGIGIRSIRVIAK